MARTRKYQLDFLMKDLQTDSMSPSMRVSSKIRVINFEADVLLPYF